MRHSRSLHALLALFSCLGGACDNGKRPTASGPQPILVLDTAASGSFARFIDPKTRKLEAALRRVGFQPDSSTHLRRFDFKKRVELVPREAVGHRKASAELAFTGAFVRRGDNAPDSIVLNFMQGLHSGRWCLELNNGYVDIDASLDDNENDPTRGLPPEFHAAVKGVFPDLIDLEDLVSAPPLCLD